jgi:hypothetical protein
MKKFCLSGPMNYFYRTGRKGQISLFLSAASYILFKVAEHPHLNLSKSLDLL